MAPHLDQSYEDLNDEQLELLLLDWMENALSIPPEAALLVLIMLGARMEDDKSENLHFHRERIIDLSQKPDELLRTFQLLDNAVPAWLATYLPDILSTTNNAIPVNMIQLQKITDLGLDEIIYFKIYLQENEILRKEEPHHWGPPYEHWSLNPGFVEEYRDQWAQIGQFADPESTALNDFIGRVKQTAEVAIKLAAYVEKGDFSALTVSENYELAAKTLGVDENFIMDAERLLLFHRDAYVPLVFEGKIKLP